VISCFELALIGAVRGVEHQKEKKQQNENAPPKSRHKRAAYLAPLNFFR
jgi:hypothetical protein